MFITITIKLGKNTSDVRIDSDQRITKCMEVLRESGKMSFDEPPAYFRSEQSEKLVSAYKTFNEEGIYDGDTLTAVV